MDQPCMKRPNFFTHAICVWLVVVSYLTTGRADNGGTFNTVRVDGRNYVNLADFVRFYEFDKNWQQNNMSVSLKSKYKWKKCQFTINSRECLINGIRIWLNESPLEYRNSILLPEVDVLKTLDPILRSWAIPEQNVKTIMIDPGHGGEDQGAQSSRATEKRLTLDLAARVEKLLREEGFRTLMTRRSDTYVSLEDRSELANASEADVFLSLHFNSAKPSSQPKGIETYCLTPVGLSSTGSIRRRLGIGDFGEEPGNRFDQHNMLLAYLIHQKLLATIPEAEDRGIKRARFFVIKAVEHPSILVENGFLSNPTEEKQILSSLYRDRLAAGIVAGVKRYSEIMNGSSK